MEKPKFINLEHEVYEINKQIAYWTSKKEYYLNEINFVEGSKAALVDMAAHYEAFNKTKEFLLIQKSIVENSDVFKACMPRLKVQLPDEYRDVWRLGNYRDIFPMLPFTVITNLMIEKKPVEYIEKLNTYEYVKEITEINISSYNLKDIKYKIFQADEEITALKKRLEVLNSI